MSNELIDDILRDLGIDEPMEETVVSVSDNIITTPIVNQTPNIDNIVDSAMESMNPTYTEYEEVSNDTENTDNLSARLEEARETFEEAIREEAPISEILHVDNMTDSIESSNSNLLPLNSNSYQINDTTLRFSGASWFNEVQSKSIIIGGAGGISSWLTMILSRLRPTQIFIYDNDVVETVNLAGQFFMLDSVNSHKVDAIARLARNFSDYYAIMAVPDRFTMFTPGGNIMMCGFDNMEARKTFFTAWKNHIESLDESNRSCCLYIDGRL